MKKNVFLLFLLIPFIGTAQNEYSVRTHKLGIGIGYSGKSVINDSIRPVELSFRYRMNDRHTFQLYAPLSYKRRSIRGADDTRRETLWGVGAGYDYTFFTYDKFGFFAGLGGDYQWFENRKDYCRLYDVYEEQEFVYTKEEVSYYWDKIKGVAVIPNIGIRFLTPKVTTELKLNIPINYVKKDSYSFYKTRNVSHESSWATWESFYIDRDINELKLQPAISMNMVYYF